MMKQFIREILQDSLANQQNIDVDIFFENSPLLRYLDLKTGAIFGNTKTRRSLANLYAIYAILHFYNEDFHNRPDEYREFSGYDYTKLFQFCRGLYGGEKLQNHALNSRVNGEFKNKIVKEDGNDLIIINGGKYAIHIDYLYVEGIDVSFMAAQIIEEYVRLLMLKDNKLIADIEKLIQTESADEKIAKIGELLDEQSEARIFEIISFVILKSYYQNIKVFFGFSLEDLQEQYLCLYKTGRTNANDGGIDFVMKPLGRFFQVTEVNNYDKYLLDIDKVMHFPITFVIKTARSKEEILRELDMYIEIKSGGMRIIRERYKNAIEEVITINELKTWLCNLSIHAVDELLQDINRYYRLELNLPFEHFETE
jgi:hypothetical protein